MLTYSDVRGEIRSGDLLAWSKRTIAARIIRAWTGETWEHVGIAYVDEAGVYVLQSTAWRGVEQRLLSECLPFDWIATNAPWSHEAENAAFARLGQRYSWGDIFRMGLGLRPSVHGVVCSTFAGDILAAIGFAVERQGLTPGHLIQMFLDAGATLRRVVQ